MKVDNAGGASSDSDGFISLMDSTPSFTPSPSHMSRTASHADEDEVEDLGFGNSNQKGKEKDNAAASAAKSDKAAPPPRPGKDFSTIIELLSHIGPSRCETGSRWCE